MAHLSSNMTQPKLPQPLYCNMDHYWLVVNNYVQLTKRHELQEKEMEKHFDTHVSQVLSKTLCDSHHGQTLRVLGVGSKEGKVQQLTNKNKQKSG